MKRRLLLVTLLACATLASARGETEPVAEATDPVPPQNTNAQQQQPERHVIASPNPTVDESITSYVEPGRVTATRVQPATSTTAAPMKTKATRPKRKRKSRQ